MFHVKHEGGFGWVLSWSFLNWRKSSKDFRAILPAERSPPIMRKRGSLTFVVRCVPGDEVLNSFFNAGLGGITSRFM